MDGPAGRRYARAGGVYAKAVCTGRRLYPQADGPALCTGRPMMRDTPLRSRALSTLGPVDVTTGSPSLRLRSLVLPFARGHSKRWVFTAFHSAPDARCTPFSSLLAGVRRFIGRDGLHCNLFLLQRSGCLADPSAALCVARRAGTTWLIHRQRLVSGVAWLIRRQRLGCFLASSTFIKGTAGRHMNTCGTVGVDSAGFLAGR